MAPLRLRLKQLRETRGLSQARLAAEAGVRQATISDLETGKSKGVDFNTVERLAKVLGVSPEALFESVPGKGKRER